jgi:phosphoglycolate phosphatase-like HAD superfamily hydrolase
MKAGDLVDAVACGDDVDHDKPDLALIEVALLRAGKVTRAEAVMIGDSPYDAIAAKHAHVRAIGGMSYFPYPISGMERIDEIRDSVRLEVATQSWRAFPVWA